MTVIATGNNARLLQEGVNRVFGQSLADHQKEYTYCFDVVSSRKAFELDVQFEGFGLAPEKTEGAGSAYDTQRQGFTPKYPHLTYSLGFIVTEENMDDNLYDLFPKKSKALAFSMSQTKEIVCANVLNRGFNSAFTMEGGDGVELFSTAHVRGPSDSTTYSNELATPAALSEAALEDLLIQINQATDARGLKKAVTGLGLVVPPSLGFEAERIVKSTLQSGTANNDINANRSMGMLPKGSMVNHYLSSNTAWFIKTNAPEGLTFFQRKAVQMQSDNEFDTSNFRSKATERYSVGWTDARGAYGSSGV